MNGMDPRGTDGAPNGRLHGEPAIAILDADVLMVILDKLLNKVDQRHVPSVELISLDRKVNLSQESFHIPEEKPSDLETIGNFRLVCPKFNEIGARYQCSRVTTRLSDHGLRRLDNIAASPTLSRNVLKFSYMVPCCYEPGLSPLTFERPLTSSVNVQLSNLPLDLQNKLQNDYHVPLGDYQQRIDEQVRISTRQQDSLVLRKAFKAFRNLQHVQLLRVQDPLDRRMYEFCRDTAPQTSPFIRMNHNDAYLRGIVNVAAALVESESPCDRFSSPHLNPESASYLASLSLGGIRMNMADIVWKLRALELMFTGGPDMDQRINKLAKSFNHMLLRAVNLRSFHVGFGGHSELPGLPIGVQFQAVFKDIHWRHLDVFGIDSWKISAQDIIDLTQRHKDKLKGLRLRNVYLNHGSMWKDVLSHLRNNLNLRWISLKGIGYASQFLPFGPDNFAADSSSDEESDGEDEELGDDNRDDDAQDDEDDSEDESVLGNHRHGGKNGHHIVVDLTSDDPDVLGDDGEFVDPENRRAWQNWVTRKH
jgi:hypothetical protein